MQKTSDPATLPMCIASGSMCYILHQIGMSDVSVSSLMLYYFDQESFKCFIRSKNYCTNVIRTEWSVPWSKEKKGAYSTTLEKDTV